LSAALEGFVTTAETKYHCSAIRKPEQGLVPASEWPCNGICLAAE